MTDYTFPSTIVPATNALSFLDNTAEFRSPLSGTTRTESRPGGHWSMLLTVANLKNLTGANDPLHELEAFIFRLNGKQHRAVIKDHAYLRSGSGGGTPVVNGAAQTGLTLNTSGWSNSTTVLYAGDRIGISGQMIPVVSDVTSGGTGLATITLAHPIRTAVASGTAIEITAPTARFILQNKAGLDARPGIFKTVMLEFQEDII